MSADTLEQNLAQYVEHEGYEVRINWCVYPEVTVFYYGQEIASKDWIAAFPWPPVNRRIARWAKKKIEAHKRLQKDLGGVLRA